MYVCAHVPAEYNVLVHNNEMYCIDVSQSVELDHPRAFDFLREGERRWLAAEAGSLRVGQSGGVPELGVTAGR